MQEHAPGWTDRNHADPGVTILELLAYAADALRVHGAPSEERAAAVAHTIALLEALTDPEPLVVRINGDKWQRVDSLDEATADARVFTFDPSTFEVTFGDGVHGQAPESGAIVTVRYRGGGDDGNLSITTRTLWCLLPQRLGVSLTLRGAAQHRGA
jgi:hypothetical protein